MPLQLHTLAPIRRRRKKRIGRGNASGSGTYSGRGQKGQRARSGGRGGLKVRGIRRMIQQLPKTRGFQSRNVRADIVHLRDLEQFPSGAVVTPGILQAKGIVAKRSRTVKILGDGVLTKKITIKGCAVSSSAREKIEKAGGTIENSKS